MSYLIAIFIMIITFIIFIFNMISNQHENEKLIKSKKIEIENKSVDFMHGKTFECNNFDNSIKDKNVSIKTYMLTRDYKVEGTNFNFNLERCEINT